MVDQKFIDALESDGKNLEVNERQTADKIERLIQSAMKVLRFLDDKIVIRNYFTKTQSGLINQLEYHSTNGILVYKDVKDVAGEEPIGGPWDDKSSEPSRRAFKKFGGTCIFLLRTGELVQFQREGRESLGEFDPATYEFRLSKPEIISVLQAVQMDGDFEMQFNNNFKNTISKTIKENPNKAPILKNVINYLKMPQDAVLIELPMDLIYSFDYHFNFLPIAEEISKDAIEESFLRFLEKYIKIMEKADALEYHQDDWR